MDFWLKYDISGEFKGLYEYSGNELKQTKNIEFLLNFIMRLSSLQMTFKPEEGHSIADQLVLSSLLEKGSDLVREKERRNLSTYDIIDKTSKQLETLFFDQYLPKDKENFRRIWQSDPRRNTTDKKTGKLTLVQLHNRV